MRQWGNETHVDDDGHSVRQLTLRKISVFSHSFLFFFSHITSSAIPPSPLTSKRASCIRTNNPSPATAAQNYPRLADPKKRAEETKSRAPELFQKALDSCSLSISDLPSHRRLRPIEPESHTLKHHYAGLLYWLSASKCIKPRLERRRGDLGLGHTTEDGSAEAALLPPTTLRQRHSLSSGGISSDSLAKSLLPCQDFLLTLSSSPSGSFLDFGPAQLSLDFSVVNTINQQPPRDTPARESRSYSHRLIPEPTCHICRPG
ncbi:hypothetical protein QBC36DRAFT_321198 [Triangularia setosa]|uniref:Uncharacterized protein n=1 Tax=Triangularia setosa TaxID=2587417 RepID=A0AAN7A970_9PEZI|nr:hypothetical protein QBC36DRAFT_321198 [Podospora setosa]